MKIFQKIEEQKITIKYLDEKELAIINTEKIIEYKVLVVGDYLIYYFNNYKSIYYINYFIY